jgi:uncharacterized membrane protein (DUF485 family)
MNTNDFSGMMSLFMVLIGVFALHAAFTGKGPVFNNDYPKAMKEDANKMLRKFCWYIGPVAVITGGLDYFWTKIVGETVVNEGPFLIAQLPFLLSMLLTFPAIIVYVVQFRKRFRQYLKKSS